jgi:hypothetical protein
VAVVEAAAERVLVAERALAVERALAADIGRRPDVHPPCRGQARDPRRGHQPVDRARAQEAAASGPAVRIARRWATCRRLARSRVPRAPAALDPARVAGRATSPIDLVELAPAVPDPVVRDLEPAVDRAILPATARGPARAVVLPAVVHRPMMWETFLIWVGQAADHPLYGLAQQRPAARSQGARRQLSFRTSRADLILARDRKAADARQPVILLRIRRVLDRAAVDNNCSPERDQGRPAAAEFNGQRRCRDKAAVVRNDRQRVRGKMVVEFNDRQLGQAKTAAEFSVRRLGLVKTAAGSCDLTAIGPDVLMDAPDVPMAFDRATAIGLTIVPIASTTAIVGTIGVKTISPKSTTTGKTIGATTTIGSTTTGGTIIIIPILTGTRAKIGGVGPPSAR